ncbi:MAG: glycosyltransferase [Xanthomonadaceae bacterium]|nr:glycosyltransferase [Xanthomonadaceae bacterium]
MHRSGTSALARVVAGLGAYAGSAEELLPAHPRDNPTGYWERSDLLFAHDEFLRASGYAWDRLARFDAANPDPAATRELRERLTHIIAILRSHGTPWLAKDPRLCLFLPVWLPLAEPVACVVAVRDPREIAASLLDTHRGVYTSHFLLALWEKYTRTLLHGLAGRSALFVAYDQLLLDPATQCAQLRDGLAELGVVGLHPQIDPDALPERSLQRSHAIAHTPLSGAQAALYDWLRAQSCTGGSVKVRGYPKTDVPDAVLAEFEHAIDDCARRTRETTSGKVERDIVQINARLSDHSNERAALLEHNAQLLQAIDEAQRGNIALRHAMDEVQQSNRILQQAIVQGNTRATQLEQTIAQTIADGKAHASRLIADSDARFEQLHGEIAPLHEEIARLRGETAQVCADRAARVAHAEQQRDALRRHAEALSASVRDLQQSWSWRATTPLRAVGHALFAGWARTENLLWRGYYALPGGVLRKRRLIVWLHTHWPWLTRHTQSYEIFTRAKDARSANPQQRMDEARAAEAIDALASAPRFSLALTLAGDDTRGAEATVETLRRQFYPMWEFVIVAGVSVSPSTRKRLSELARRDPRVRVKYRKLEPDTARACNVALSFARGDYVVFFEMGNELARDALLAIARAIARDGSDLIYSDEDAIAPDGRHTDPVFKPDFSLDLLQSTNYIDGLFVVRRKLLQERGGPRAGFAGAMDYELLLRLCENSPRIAHIPQVLYHRHDIALEPDDDDAIAALRQSLARRRVDADVEPGRLPQTYRVRRRITGKPLVSILLPFRDKPGLLRACVTSLLEKTRYANFELVGIDNGSIDEKTGALMHEYAAHDARVRFVRHDVPFNYSAIINFGVTQTRGEHLLMLNNDTVIISEEWIEALLEHSQRPEIGAVGALLRYRNDTIQHGGVILKLGGSVAGHAHLQVGAREPGYCRRAQVIQNLSAVTFACAMTRRDVFDRLGGLDARNLIAAYNDIDYCLRLREAGYLIVFTPYAELYHEESASRPHDLHPEQRARYEREIRYMRERHAGILERGDPYYNPNLSLVQGYLPSLDYLDTLPA